MDYKIIALDLDGTLTNSEKKITSKTKEAIINAQKLGVKVVLASGRPVQGIVPLAEELELKKYNGFILAFNGAKIINYNSNNIIYDKYLSDEIKQKVYDLSIKFNTEINTYENDKLIAEKSNKYLELESKINKMEIKLVDSFVDYVNFHVTKYMLTGDGGHLKEIEPIVYETLKENANVFRSEPYFLEIVPKNLDKAASLDVLLSKIGLRKEQLMAFGDGFNDKSMIEYAGLGVAMDNAQQVVKDVADFVTLSNNDDGIAYALNEFIFKKQRITA